MTNICYMETQNNFPIKSFSNSTAWRQWLDENHRLSDGIWLRFYKKESKVATVARDEAIDEALCYGWIDGQIKKYDEQSWLVKFTPRRLRSIWSKKNIENIERLAKAGRMKPSGLEQIKLAKSDGRWEKAYDSASNMKIPEDFLKELEKNKQAYEFFKTLNKANTYAIGWRLQTSKKPETRAKRMEKILEMMSKGEKFH